MASSNAVAVSLHPSSLTHEPLIWIPKSLLSEWKIRVGQVKNIYFGQKSCQARVSEQPDEPGRKVIKLYLSRDLIQRLHCPVGSVIELCSFGNDLKLGPVVGILANVRLVSGKPAGMQEPVFTKLLNAAQEERVFAYVFSPKNVHFSNGLVKGYIWSEQKGWSVGEFPLPDVVYDQIISRKFAESDSVISFRKQFTGKPRVYYFNPSFFDKWQVHEWLNRDLNAKIFLPDTINYHSITTAAHFLDLHKFIYMKPVNGSLGIGIIRVVKLTNGKYQYQIKTRNGVPKEGIAASSTELFRLLDKRLKKEEYVIQKGLHLLLYEGRSFDIRAVMQKDRFGKWRRTKSVCRVSKPGDITSNLTTGGDALPVQKVLSETLKDKSAISKVNQQLTKLVRTVPETLERHSGLLLGEVGLDIGVDQSGNVWLIEVNSKPWKKPTTEQGSMELVNQSFARPMQFAKYLAQKLG